MDKTLQSEQAPENEGAAPLEEITAQQDSALAGELRETRNKLGQQSATRKAFCVLLDEAKEERFHGVPGAAAREAEVSARLARHDAETARLEARELEIVQQRRGAAPAQLRAEAARRYGLTPELAACLEGQDAQTIEANARALSNAAQQQKATAPGQAFPFQQPGEVAW